MFRRVGEPFSISGRSVSGKQEVMVSENDSQTSGTPNYSKGSVRRFAKSLYQWSLTDLGLTQRDGSVRTKNTKDIIDKLFEFSVSDTCDHDDEELEEEEIKPRNTQDSVKGRTLTLNKLNQLSGLSKLKVLGTTNTEPHIRRVVVLNDIPPLTSISSILAQLCGGPLERVIFRKDGAKGSNTCEIYFMFPEHAANFYEFSTRTNLFILNGKQIAVKWATRSNTNDLDNSHPSVPVYLLNEFVQWGARRCLVFSKAVSTKSPRNSSTMHYPNAKANFSKGVSYEEIKSDLSVFGEIVEIAPVISRKLCFSVHFADIRSAIVAKKVCETPSTPLNIRYNDWTLWYGKDPTDTPCHCL